MLKRAGSESLFPRDSFVFEQEYSHLTSGLSLTDYLDFSSPDFSPTARLFWDLPHGRLTNSSFALGPGFFGVPLLDHGWYVASLRVCP